MGYYSNTSVLLCSYPSISYFSNAPCEIFFFKLAYHLKTFVKDVFTSILFNVVVMATIYFSCCFTYAEIAPVPLANEGKNNLFLFLHMWHPITTVNGAGRIKRIWAVLFSSWTLNLDWQD